MTCLECGAENAEATEACARCGAPIGLQQPVAAPALGLPHTWVAQQASPRNSRRGVLIAASTGAGVLIALIALIAIVGARISSAPSAGQPTGARISPAPSGEQLTTDEMQPGDCLAGSNMGLGDSNPWPESVTRVACTQPHEAEVFFVGDNWPQSQGYPGASKVSDQADARCDSAFTTYDGIGYEQSEFSIIAIVPSSSDDWATGDRSLECVAFESSPSGPSGGEPVDYSVKGSMT